MKPGASLVLVWLLLLGGCTRWGFDASADGGAAWDAGIDGEADGQRDGGEGGDDGGPVSSLLITAPNNGNDDEWFETVVVVRGTCSPDVVELQTERGVLDDADCSDGTWSLAPFSLDYPPGPRVFAVSGMSAQGPLQDSISVDYTYVRLAWGNNQVYTHDNPGLIAGHCSPAVVSLELNLGSLVDVDCSDTTFSLELSFPEGEGSYPLEATGTDAQVRSQSDDTEVIYDITPPPAPIILASAPESPAAENFPLLSGDGERNCSIQLYLDPACTQAASPRAASWQETFWNEGLPIAVADGSRNELHVSAMDRARNRGPCSSTPFVYEDSSATTLPACDVSLSGRMTFVELQAALDQAHRQRDAYLGDGILAVCLEDGATVETSSAAEGGRIRLPGDDMLLTCPGGRAQLINRRRDGVPTVEEAQGGLWLDGVAGAALSNLDVRVEGPVGVALGAQAGSINFLRDLNLEAKRCAVDFPLEPLTMRLAEMRNCTLRATTAMRVRNSRIGLIEGCQFHFQGGTGLSLDNANILVGEIRDSLFSSDDADTGGVGFDIHTANRGASIQKMTGCTLQRIASATSASGRAMWFRNYGSDSTYVSTPNFRDNHLCGPWESLIEPQPGPTQAWDPSRVSETNGVDSVPWGDASHAGDNPGYNWQATWGGDCP